jgi:hypothetical protein
MAAGIQEALAVKKALITYHPQQWQGFGTIFFYDEWFSLNVSEQSLQKYAGA